jgi:hypothetical protein
MAVYVPHSQSEHVIPKRSEAHVVKGLSVLSYNEEYRLLACDAVWFS